MAYHSNSTRYNIYVDENRYYNLRTNTLQLCSMWGALLITEMRMHTKVGGRWLEGFGDYRFYNNIILLLSMSS